MSLALFPAEQLALLFDRNAYTDSVWQPSEAQVVQWVLACLTHCLPNSHRANKVEISVSCVASKAIRALNADYRSKDSVTNVLSFPADMPTLPADDDSSVPTVVLGDVVICPEVLEVEAKQQNKPIEQHWAHMVIHSVLHLNGLDHEDDIEAQAMESLEIEILSTLGITNPYLAVSAK